MAQDKKKSEELLRGMPHNIGDLVDYREGSIVSRTLVDDTSGIVTLFAFDQGQRLSEHTSPYDALVHILDGACEITISGETHTVCAGELIIMPADSPHAVSATQPFKMMLVMIRG
jgi:quercetin dioxygenase-like cupin family protein